MKIIHFYCLTPFSYFIPYTYGALRAYCEQFPDIIGAYRWTEPKFLIDSTLNLEDEYFSEGDIICFSCSMWNFNLNMQLAALIRQKQPYCKIVCGGPQLPLNPKGFFSKYPFVDIIVHGEGEIALSKILREELQQKPNLADIPGLTINNEGTEISTGQSELLHPEINYPSPFLLGLFEPSVNLLTRKEISPVWLWESARGCRFGCAFCYWGSHAANVRVFSLGRLQEEIEYFGKKSLAKDIFLCDPNFGLQTRDVVITDLLISTKKRTGFPKTFKAYYDANTSERVFNISKNLHQNDMLWSVTLSMQSLNPKTLREINRPFSISAYHDAQKRYVEAGVPTYTEIMVGLPSETKISFIDGLMTLFENNHDNLVLHPSVLLPNTLFSEENYINKYGLKINKVPFYFHPAEDLRSPIQEFVNLVVGSNTLNFADWIYCNVFGDIVTGLHTGCYTKFLSQYLHREKILNYKEFYVGLIEFAANQGKGVLFDILQRLKKLYEELGSRSDIPYLSRVDSQPDLVAELIKFLGSNIIGIAPRYIWLKISDHFDGFYNDMDKYLQTVCSPRIMDGFLRDLLHYQKEIMLRPEYDPETGKSCCYQNNWPQYFFEKQPLKNCVTHVKYNDKAMGADFRYKLKANDLAAFSMAALGSPRLYCMIRHFFHQYDQTKTVTKGH